MSKESLNSGMVHMLSNCGLSVENYDNTLTGWAAQNVQMNVILYSFGLYYSNAGEVARDYLVNNYNWTIKGDLPAGYFTTIWQTDNDGVSDNNQIVIPAEGDNYTVIWEDVNNPEKSDSLVCSGECTLTFPDAGTYEIRISGDLDRINFGMYDSRKHGDHKKLMEVKQWGNIKWKSMESAFENASNLKLSASDIPDLSNVTSLRKMFKGASSFNSNIGYWNVGNVKDMNEMFEGTALTKDNFDTTLVNWAKQELMNSKAYNESIAGMENSNYKSLRKFKPGQVGKQESEENKSGEADAIEELVEKYEKMINWSGCDNNMADKEETSVVPKDFVVEKNYLNPLNLKSSIRYGLPKPSMVCINVYDMKGRKIANLQNGYQKSGWHELLFDATRFPGGMYFFQIKAGEFNQTRRIMLCK